MTKPRHELAASLRAIRKASITGYTTGGGPPVLSIHGTAERLDDILAAADELERTGREELGALSLVADIRAALGDPTGKLMQDELIKRASKAWAALEARDGDTV